MISLDNYYKYSFSDLYCDMLISHKKYVGRRIPNMANQVHFLEIINKLDSMLKLHNDLESFIKQIKTTSEMITLSKYEKLAYETMIDICESLQKKGY